MHSNDEADEIAFVCPDYAGAIPKIVREFVSKGTFKAPYIFSVITYGNACVNVAEYWDEFCQEHCPGLFPRAHRGRYICFEHKKFR